MQKLTPEQRDYLCSKVRAAFGNTCADLYGVSAERIRELTIQLINQCTGQEFPAFQMLNWSIYQHGNGIRMESAIMKYWLTNDEFLQFAQGITKIKEWLEQNIK